MKMLSKKEYQEICIWIHRNARPLELSIWNYHFEGGRREEIIRILSFYQNEDGGFGNGVEPDGWNPESSPYASMVVTDILRIIGFMEENGADHPMVKGIFRFLESGKYCNEDGWFFCIPSNDAYPHAPWWTFDEKLNQEESMGITAALCGFILRYGDRESKLYRKAADYAEKILAEALARDDFGEMGAGGVCMLFSDIMESGLSSSFTLEGLPEKLAEIVNSSIERDPANWAFYTKRPSIFIHSPESPFYKGNEEIVEKELEYLIDNRNKGGVWNITWSWFDLTEKYGKEFAVSENWWMSSKAMENIGFLKSFGRIEE